MAEANQIPDYRTNFSLGSLAGIPEDKWRDETGIPYATDMYSLPLATTGRFYGTGVDPSQRFIFQRLKRDSQGDPIKMFEEWETFDEKDKEWIAEMDQRRDELQPDEISTLDALKMVAGDAMTPYLQDAAKKFAYASAAESGGETALSGLGLDPFGLDASQVSKAKTAMEFGDSPTSYALKSASPVHTTNYEQMQAIAEGAPDGYVYNPDIEAQVMSGQIDSSKAGQFMQTKDGHIYYDRMQPPKTRTGVGTQAMATSGRIPKSTGYGGYGQSMVKSATVGSGAPSGMVGGYGGLTQQSIASVPVSMARNVAVEPSFWSGESFSSRAGESFAPTTMASNFAVSFAVGLALGKGKPMERAEEAADSAFGSTVGTAIGTAIGGPIGGFIGGAIGGLVGSGGRVICNELMNQKLLTRQDVILDYRFTRDYLTPTHVKGYHVWAIHVVQQMRKGRFVKFWKHIAKHRANEIAYIYGKKDKPDYLGKIYRKIGEPTCWVIGVFCEQSDWSILYKEKKIGN